MCIRHPFRYVYVCQTNQPAYFLVHSLSIHQMNKNPFFFLQNTEGEEAKHETSHDYIANDIQSI